MIPLHAPHGPDPVTIGIVVLLAVSGSGFGFLLAYHAKQHFRE